jgi:hypothetical protein
MRSVYAGKRRALVAALDRYAPDAEPLGLAAGDLLSARAGS